MKIAETKRGRPEIPASERRKSRAVCRLDADDKRALEAYAEKQGQSESDILRAGLVALGILRGEHEASDS